MFEDSCQLQERGRGKSLICTKITFSIWVPLYLTSTDVPLLFSLSWMTFRIKLGIGWFTVFRAYFVRKWAGLLQGPVGWIHTFVFAAVSSGSAVHQPLPNDPLFSSVSLLCLAFSLQVAAVNHPNPSPTLRIPTQTRMHTTHPSVDALLDECQSFALLLQYLAPLLCFVALQISLCAVSCRIEAEGEETVYLPRRAVAKAAVWMQVSWFAPHTTFLYPKLSRLNSIEPSLTYFMTGEAKTCRPAFHRCSCSINTLTTYVGQSPLGFAMIPKC